MVCIVKKKVEDLDLDKAEASEQMMAFKQLGALQGKNTPNSPCPNCSMDYLSLVYRMLSKESDHLGMIEQFCMCPNCRAVSVEYFKAGELDQLEMKQLSEIIEFPKLVKKEPKE